MKTLTIEKIDALVGEVNLVGSKSLTNRAFVLSALSEGDTILKNFLRSDDTEVMLESLAKIGIRFQEKSTDTLTMTGVGQAFETCNKCNEAYLGLSKEELFEKATKLFLGNSGTSMRSLCSILAASGGVYELTGEPRMYERPIGHLVDALRSLGAYIEYLGNEGYPPLRIVGLKNPKIKELVPECPALVNDTYEVSIPGNISSQFITALLMTGPLLDKKFKLKVIGELISQPYVTMTCKLLKQFGVEVKNNGFAEFEVEPTKYKSPGKFLIEGDASAATYFLAGAAIHGDVKVHGVGRNSLQGDAAFINYLERMGARIEIGDDYMHVQSSSWPKNGLAPNQMIPNRHYLNGIDDDFNDIPDAAMTFVPLALYTMGDITIRNIESWRVKETDRIAAMATEMKKLGVIVDEGQDYISLSVWQDMVENDDEEPDDCGFMTVPCREPSREYVSVVSSGKTISFDTYNDHRMAMCMSLIALDRTIIINDPDCCKKTFPEYFTILEKLALRRNHD